MSQFRRIGAGACGSVWAPPQQDNSFIWAFKREDGSSSRSLCNDYEMLQLLNITMTKMRSTDPTYLLSSSSHPRISIPQYHALIQPGDQEWWRVHLPSFPGGYTSCNTLQFERIPPIPRDTRELLIEKFCRADLIKVIKASDADCDCLIRPYLGRRRFSRAPSKCFSLRNFPLHVDQMESLGLGDDITKYAKTMADALAMMHWDAQIDANDVEFVLAPPRKGELPQFINALGAHTMWLLDFDLCKDIAMNQGGVRQAVDAFFRNDPYYPKPGQSLWKCFRETYLHVRSRIVAQHGDHDREKLPPLFIEQVEKKQKERDEQQQRRQKASEE